jgi:ankyrin repeat protein
MAFSTDPCPEMIQLLLNQGADINWKSDQSAGILSMAIVSGAKPNVVKQLLSKGARVNEADLGGYTPLHQAGRFGRLLVAEILLEHGADRTARSKHGFTPADCALQRGHRDVWQLILSWKTSATTRQSNETAIDSQGE